MSQYQLADRFHTTQSSISGLERGRVDITAAQLVDMAQILRKPVVFFFPSESDEAPDEQQLLAMYRSLPPQTQQAAFAMLAAQYKLAQEAKEIEALPKEQQENAAIDAFARFLAQQGVKVTIDDAGYPVLDGGDVKAILETMSDKEHKALVEAVRRMQQRRK